MKNKYSDNYSNYGKSMTLDMRVKEVQKVTVTLKLSVETDQA